MVLPLVSYLLCIHSIVFQPCTQHKHHFEASKPIFQAFTLWRIWIWPNHCRLFSHFCPHNHTVTDFNPNPKLIYVTCSAAIAIVFLEFTPTHTKFIYTHTTLHLSCKMCSLTDFAASTPHFPTNWFLVLRLQLLWVWCAESMVIFRFLMKNWSTLVFSIFWICLFVMML